MTYPQSFINFYESDFGTRVLREQARYVARWVEPQDLVLNVGTGVGALEKELSSYRILGLDRDPDMIHAAARWAPGPYVVADALRIPFSEETADGAVSIATIEFLPKPVRVLKEMIRVTASGGPVVLLILNTKSQYVTNRRSREGSYFQRMVYTDTPELVERLGQHLDGSTEYILGIDEDRVFETDDPAYAAFLAFHGTV